MSELTKLSLHFFVQRIKLVSYSASFASFDKKRVRHFANSPEKCNFVCSKNILLIMTIKLFKERIFAVLFLFFIASFVTVQANSPKREFRGAWIQ